MKLIDKIIDFESVDELMLEINSDKITSNILSRRYPVRLIFLQRFETFRLLIEKLSSFNIDILHVEKELPQLDGWITKDSLYTLVKNISKDTTVVPFSEIVRFYSREDFNNFFNQLLLIENDDLKRRIYLPLIGVEERFEKDFFQSFTRKEESAPLWKISKETPNSIKLFLFPKSLRKKIDGFETINDTNEWLQFWKRKSPCDIICHSKALNLYYENTLPDTIFNVEKLLNLKIGIEKIYRIEVPIAYCDTDHLHWEKLLDLINLDCSNFSTLVKCYFKVTALTINTILDLWLQASDIFAKWLLKGYLLSQKCLENKYLFKVVESLSDFSDHTFLKTLYERIFTLEFNDDFVNERLKLIHQYSRYKKIILCDEAIEDLNAYIRSLEDSSKALLLTTGVFFFEKVFILELYVKQAIDRNIILKRFPDLIYYNSHSLFDNINADNNWVYEYFEEYKKSKLINSKTPRINEILLSKNENESSFFNWYHSFESIHSIFHSNKVDKVIWVDAIGCEWVAFIENYINNYYTDFSILNKLIGVSNLPTSTEHNKFPDTKYVQDFDLFIHTNRFLYPESIINEFVEISKIINSLLIVDSDQTIALVSDHGLTALSRLELSRKYGKDDSHEGRYIEVSDKDHSTDPDYIINKSELDNKTYLIASKHNSLGKKPIREVHGGATPEEVLVPYIVISNKKELDNFDYSIAIFNSEIQKREPVVQFEIQPKPIKVNAEINSDIIGLTYNNISGKWEAELSKSLSGVISLTIKVGKTEKQFKINIISGLIEEDLF